MKGLYKSFVCITIFLWEIPVVVFSEICDDVVEQ